MGRNSLNSLVGFFDFPKIIVEKFLFTKNDF